MGVESLYKREVTLKFLTSNTLIQHKAGLLNLAEELSNVLKARKIMGVSRDTFIITASWPMNVALMRLSTAVVVCLT